MPARARFMTEIRHAAQEWKAELGVDDYSISQVTLEQVFLNDDAQAIVDDALHWT